MPGAGRQIEPPVRLVTEIGKTLTAAEETVAGPQFMPWARGAEAGSKKGGQRSSASTGKSRPRFARGTALVLRWQIDVVDHDDIHRAFLRLQLQAAGRSGVNPFPQMEI